MLTRWKYSQQCSLPGTLCSKTEFYPFKCFSCRPIYIYTRYRYEPLIAPACHTANAFRVSEPILRVRAELSENVLFGVDRSLILRAENDPIFFFHLLRKNGVLFVLNRKSRKKYIRSRTRLKHLFMYVPRSSRQWFLLFQMLPGCSIISFKNRLGGTFTISDATTRIRYEYRYQVYPWIRKYCCFRGPTPQRVGWTVTGFSNASGLFNN